MGLGFIAWSYHALCIIAGSSRELLQEEPITNHHLNSGSIQKIRKENTSAIRDEERETILLRK